MPPPLFPLFAVLLALAGGGASAAPEALRVAVASNFRGAAEIVNARFTEATGIAVRMSSGATGALYSQIEHGAPFDLFLAADSERPARLAAAGTGLDDSRGCYARGRLVLLGAAPDFAQLADPAYSVAVANPATAPYGVAAVEVLARPAFRGGAARRLVRGANVLQAYQFYRAGAVDLALVARSLAPDAGLLVPAGWHLPIEQHAVVIAASPRIPAARRYLALLRGAPLQQRLAAAGYDPCP
jgi:molybdate transport system substrate-binding protein